MRNGAGKNLTFIIKFCFRQIFCGNVQHQPLIATCLDTGPVPKWRWNLVPWLLGVYSRALQLFFVDILSVSLTNVLNLLRVLVEQLKEYSWCVVNYMGRLRA